MLVLGRANSRQLRKVDAAIRRHVQPVAADRLPASRGRYVPVEIDGGPDRDGCQIEGCTRRTRCACARARARDHVGGGSLKPVERGDVIAQEGATVIMLVVEISADPVLDPIAAYKYLDPVLGDGVPAFIGRCEPPEIDGVGVEGGPLQLPRRRGSLRQRHARGRRGNAWNPAGHRGGNHEEAGPQAQSVPSHPAASFRAVEKTCARVCVKPISIGWRTLAPAPHGLVIAATPPRPASRG